MLLNDTKQQAFPYQSVNMEHVGSTKKGCGTKENIREWNVSLSMHQKLPEGTLNKV